MQRRLLETAPRAKRQRRTVTEADAPYRCCRWRTLNRRRRRRRREETSVAKREEWYARGWVDSGLSLPALLVVGGSHSHCVWIVLRKWTERSGSCFVRI